MMVSARGDDIRPDLTLNLSLFLVTYHLPDGIFSPNIFQIPGVPLSIAFYNAH